MLNASHLSMEAACRGCGITYTFQKGETEQVCNYCKKIVYAPKPEVNMQEVESLLDEGNRLCNDLEFKDARYYYLRAKEMDPSCADAYWGLIRAAYGVQILYEDKTETRYVLSTLRVPQEVDQCKDWHTFCDKLKEQSKKYEDDIKRIRLQQQQMKSLWSEGWRGEYDIFLCYKETERYLDPASGKICSRASKDREWVHAFYNELSRQNAEREDPFRIFFAPETLKGKAGDSYAAHLSHALMTSQVMLLMGTQPEYFDTSWMLGERRRFYHYMEEEDYSRKIIPIFNSLLTGGKSIEEVIPKECTEIQGIDAAGDMENKARMVLAICAEALKPNQGTQPKACQHIVSERLYDNVREKKEQLARELKNTKNDLEKASQNIDKYKQEKEYSDQKLQDVLNQIDKVKLEIQGKNKEIEEIKKLNYKAEMALNNEHNENELLRGQIQGLQNQKADADAEVREKNQKIAVLEINLNDERIQAEKYRNEVLLLEKQKAAAESEIRDKDNKIIRLESENATAQLGIRDKDNEISRLKSENTTARFEIRDKDKEISRLESDIKVFQNEIRKLEIENAVLKGKKEPPSLSPPPPPPTTPSPKQVYQIREYGFRQSTDPNGAKHYPSDLTAVKKEDLRKLDRIDEIFIVIRSRRNRSVSVSVLLEGMAGQYSESAKVTLVPNMIKEIGFRLGGIQLCDFTGEFMLTITDDQNETQREILTLRGR